MKIKGRESDAWHKNVDKTAGLRKPTDVDFPWIALQNQTGYYVKKKGQLSQDQVEERLLALIKNHSSRHVAIAACAHSLSAQATRNLLVSYLRVESDDKLAYAGYLQAIIAAGHVNTGAVSEIEARWACFILEYEAVSSSSRRCDQQLRNILPLVSNPVKPGLLLEADITGLAYKVCLDYAKQLEVLRLNNQWSKAHATVVWLSTMSNSIMLQEQSTGARHLLDSCLPKWRAWAAWRPKITRLDAWSDHSRALSILKDLFALEGPDIMSRLGSEQVTLRDGLIAKGSGCLQSTLCWGKSSVTFQKNPFREHENLNGILQRLTDVIDFSCSTDHEYTKLLAHLCAFGAVNNAVLEILEGVRVVGTPTFTTVILEAFELPQQSAGQEVEKIRQILPALNDHRIRGLRERMKPYIIDRISDRIRELRSAFLLRTCGESQWEDAAMELLTFTYGLQEESWLLSEMEPSVRQTITSAPSLMKVETLAAMRNQIQSMALSAPTHLLGQINAYSKALVLPDAEEPPPLSDLIEALIFLWHKDTDADRRQLAVLTAVFPNITCQLKCDCIQDIASFSHLRVVSTIEAFKTPNAKPDLGFITLVSIIVSEDKPDRMIRWRSVLSFAIEKQHEAFLRHAMTHLTAGKWLELLSNIRAVYHGTVMIRLKDETSPTLFSLGLHQYSEGVTASHIPTLTRLETRLKGGPAMQTLLLGSTGPIYGQLRTILDIVDNRKSSSHERLMETVIALLHSQNTDVILDVLRAVSEARSVGAEICLSMLDSKRKVSSQFAEVSLASNLRAAHIEEQDRVALRKVARLFEIRLNSEEKPSQAGLKEYAQFIREENIKLIAEAQRLENLRLSLRAVAPGPVSRLLSNLHIEAPSVVDDTLASLPPSLASLFEKGAHDEIEIHFPTTDLTKLQRFAIGASDTESFLIRLTLRNDGVPIKFCVHLSGDSGVHSGSGKSPKRQSHTPWEVFRGNRPPHEQYCHGRPNRGVYQLSRILRAHLRYSFKSLEQTHAHIASKISKFGQGCLMCGQGQRRLRRATICQSKFCISTFLLAHVEIQLTEVWHDPPVMDLLLTTIHAAAATGNLDLLATCPVPSASTASSMLKNLPAIESLAKHLTSCLNVQGVDFRLARALEGYCTTYFESTALASSLSWACSSYRGFIVSATGPHRIPSFGSNQFLLANTAPELEIAFAHHIPTSTSITQILFHGTSLDRLHAIICQGLCVQSGTSLQRNGAVYGAGIYMADEPSTAWTYATASVGGWKSSKLKNMKVLLGCELAGPKPRAPYNGIYVITDATRLAVRYIFLLEGNARVPAAKDVRTPMGSVFQSLRSGTL